jgi:hypothetical protein
MSVQPFQTPSAELIPDGHCAVALRQPLTFTLVQFITALTVFVVTTGWLWLHTDQLFLQDRIVQALPRMVGSFLGGLVFVLALTFWLVHQQRERYRIACFRPMPGLLITFALLSVLLGQAWSVVGTALRGYVFPILQTLEGYSLWAACYSLLYSLVGAALSCGVPLWMVLRFSRSRSELLAAGEMCPVPVWHVACAVALLVFALYLKVVGMLLLALSATDVAAEDWLYVFFAGLPLFAVCWAAVQTRLQQEVSHFAAGRVILTSVVVVALWVGLLVVSVVGISAFSRGEEPSDALTLLLYLLLQAAIWPLSRWSLRWCYIGSPARA